ncbi:MAG: oxygen-independent coproporphyrinogen III oxidase [Chitinophagaceae bacterium]|nr:oxygen-independent coproporphyrinogen III oxidase [Chitinophagaceae bacterium]
MQLIQRYNVPVPRYTSYPTVPFWPQSIDAEEWISRLKQRFEGCNNTLGISLYIHLPFCESLCTYCGCNKKITTNHTVEMPYIKALLQEWKMYKSILGSVPVVREIHIGGGTPTFFSPENLDTLLSGIKQGAMVHSIAECSIEGHPNNTNAEHLDVLYHHGFTRISYGVQDNDAKVQALINRIQPWENVLRATWEAREVGFKSINYDLIYGLPGQTLSSMEKTLREVLSVRPDRIAFYSYAHVPWTSRGQRLFDENDLPDAQLKMQLYMLGKAMFTNAGYADIGMDHYALPGEALFQARAEGRLHRNFMGYTTRESGMLIGLGVSSISDAGNAYAQNYKALHEYYDALEHQLLPVFRGCMLNEEDERFKKYILDITCKGITVPTASDMRFISAMNGNYLLQLLMDGLIEIDHGTIKVTPSGNHFLRNIARIFDIHLLRSERDTNSERTFSRAI